MRADGYRPEADVATQGEVDPRGVVTQTPPMSLRIALIALAGCISLNVAGEIEKIASPTDRGFAFNWWPKVEPPKGWHRDEDQSFSYGVNALAPDGGSPLAYCGR